MQKMIVSIMLAVAGTALAGGASHWTHSSEAEFKKGTFHNVVATNLGELKLSRAVKMLLEQDARISYVYSLAETPDGTIYAGTGPNGILLSIKNDKVTTVLTLDDANIFSLKVDAQGALLIGTGGEKGRILKIAKPGDKPVEIFSAEGVQYIWSMVQTPDGNIYAATGPHGQLFEIKPDGTKTVIFDSDETNLLSMVSDGKDTLYFGTDPNGLVYRFNRKTKAVFVLFDAPEGEVATLALDAKGNLYAGTAQAGDSPEMEAAQRAATEKSGRPEEQGAPALPANPPKDPKPPEIPNPTPGDPAPIPKKISPMIVQGDLLRLFDNDDEAKPARPAPQPPKGKPKGPTTRPGNRPPVIPGDGGNKAPAEGNAIYKIDPDGFVSEVFRENVLFLSMIERDGALIVGTGSEGFVYQVNPAAEETVILAKSDSKHVMALLSGKDGRIVMGLANTGALATMSSGFATDGTYNSAVLDASQISRFGKAHLLGTLPKGATLTLATRSGNVEDPEGTGWSNWSEDAPASQFVQVKSSAARYMQYRLTFTSKEGKETATVNQVDVAYQMPNLAPQVKGIHVMTPPPQDVEKGKTPAQVRIVTWEAIDPNNDTMEFALYFRTQGTAEWILLKDELKEPMFEWDTRGTADGRYEVKVVASDAKANPRGEGKTGTRLSEALVVDNTPPVIGDLKSQITGRSVKISLTLVDRTGEIAACAYALDSKDNWQAVQASDNIFDSPEETVSFTIDDLAPGTHLVMIRATDDQGNQSYENVSVVIPAEKK